MNTPLYHMRYNKMQWINYELEMRIQNSCSLLKCISWLAPFETLQNIANVKYGIRFLINWNLTYHKKSDFGRIIRKERYDWRNVFRKKQIEKKYEIKFSKNMCMHRIEIDTKWKHKNGKNSDFMIVKLKALEATMVWLQ